MDIFKRMNQRTTTDFSVFKPRKVNQAQTTEPPKKAEEPIPFPKEPEKKDIMKPESVEPVAEEPTTEPAEELNPVLDEPTAEEEQKETGKVIQFKQPENIGEEASVKLEAELETTKSTLLPVFPIVRYLKNKCLAETEFAELVLDEKKSLKKYLKILK